MIAFVFPGQGSQRVGMGRALSDAFPESRAVFEAADQALGEPLSKLCFDGPEDQLQLTANTQPAILAVSLAALATVRARGIEPDFVAGHSLGEYSALVCAGVLSAEAALTAVRRRGQYMQAAVPPGEGAMSAILMLDLPAIEDACREAAQGQVVAPANINGPGQIVIAGHAAAVERAGEACQARGARRVVPLPVSAPFHCSLMEPAQVRLAKDFESLAFADARMPIVNNVDARMVRAAGECRDGLIRQVSGAVRWQESVERLLAEGVDTFVELGPGAVLSGLVKKIARPARILNVEDPQSLERSLAALAQPPAAS